MTSNRESLDTELRRLHAEHVRARRAARADVEDRFQEYRSGRFRAEMVVLAQDLMSTRERPSRVAEKSQPGTKGRRKGDRLAS